MIDQDRSGLVWPAQACLSSGSQDGKMSCNGSINSREPSGFECGTRD